MHNLSKTLLRIVRMEAEVAMVVRSGASPSRTYETLYEHVICLRTMLWKCRHRLIHMKKNFGTCK